MLDRDELDAADPEFDKLGFSTRAINPPVDLSLNRPAQFQGKIMVVYWIWILMPVLTPQFNLADVVRGMVGFTIFCSAYVAEYVRSGLQAVPRGQTEAARSLGMSELDTNRSTVLPQALRVVVPPLVGNVLDIFNAAPLVFIIGLTDFLRAGQMIFANPQYGDRTYEVYSFLFLTYFLIGSLITFVARKLEVHLAKGSR